MVLSLAPWDTALRSLSETDEAAWLRDDLCEDLLDAVWFVDACRRDLRVCGSAEDLGTGRWVSGAGVPRSELDLTLSSISRGLGWTKN